MKKTLVLLLIVALLPLSFIGKAKAITGLSVTPSPNTAGSIATYTIAFTLAYPLPAGGSINVTFTGFTIPASIANTSIYVNGFPVTSAGVAGQIVTLFPSQASGLPAGYVYIYIYSAAAIRNPSTGGNYPVIVGTSVVTETPQSVNVSIASAISNVYVSVNPLNAGSIADYVIQFTPGVTLPASYYIYVEFPTGTSIPTSIQSSLVTVNGVSSTSVTLVLGTKIQIRTPVQLTAGYNCVISIPQTVGIANPAASGTYTIKVSTQLETAAVDSNTFILVGSNITNLSVYVSPDSASTAATYTIQFLTGASGALTATTDWIKIEFPSGTTVPTGTGASYISINGRTCTNRYVSGNSLTVYIPATLNISNSSWVFITISDSFGIINPSSVGTYTLKVSTSKDTIPATSNSYSITGTSVSNFVANADPATQNSNAQYTFTFVTSSSGALTSGSDKIYIQFPTQFTLPSSITGSYVTVNGTACTTSVSVSSSKLTITTPLNISNSSNVTVIVSKSANIYNASTPATYTFKASTNKDVVEVSDTFAIVTSTITKPIVQLTGYAVSEVVGVTITFQTGTGGALTASSDKVSITFPTGFVLPSSISNTYVKVNNYNAASVSKSGQRIDITPSVNISANSTVTIVIDKSANIKNPASQGDYKLSVYTSKETTSIDSDTFKIVILPTTTATVTPANPDGKNGYYRTRPRVILTATSPVDTSPQIYYKFDNETAKLYTVPIDVYEGVHTLYYYAVDKYQNTEQQKSIQFKVDTTAPIITVTSPANNSVLSTNTFNITGRTEAGATLTINGNPVSLQPDGSFTYTATISRLTNFTFIAEDVAGNTATFVLTVSLDTTPPVLNISEPKAFTEIHTQLVTVKGTTEKDAKVKVNGADVTVNLNTGAFEYTVTLINPGLNSIEVEATDIAGNATKSSIPVNYIPKTKMILQVGNTNAIVNDKTVKLDAAPKIVNGRTLVPIRFVAESFGATVTWDPIFKLVIITLDKNQIFLQIGTTFASVNGKKVTLDAAPMISGGYTLVPIRFISESLGADVQWEPNTQTITIIYPK